MVVPVTTAIKRYPFEAPVPNGINTNHPRVNFSQLSGVVLTDQAKSLDLDARDTVVIGEVDPASSFFKSIVTNVRSILA